MTIFNYLQHHHRETVECAVKFHRLTQSEKGKVFSEKALKAAIANFEEKERSKELAAKFNLACFANKNRLLESESLELARGICEEMGISEDDFALASQYKQVEAAHATN